MDHLTMVRLTVLEMNSAEIAFVSICPAFFMACNARVTCNMYECLNLKDDLIYRAEGLCDALAVAGMDLQ